MEMLKSASNSLRQEQIGQEPLCLVKSGSVALPKTNPESAAPASSEVSVVTAKSPSTEQTDTQETKAAPKKPLVRKIITGILALVLVGAGGQFGIHTYNQVSTHEETDDAYVTGHLHQVSTRVNGTVDQVLVDDNEHVKQGQVLVLLDPRDYKVKVTQAMANLLQAERKATVAKTSVSFQSTTAEGQDTDAKGSIDSALAAISKSQAGVREAKAAIESSQANLAAKDAELERAQLDYNRYYTLEREGAVSTSERDSARRDYLVALESRNVARKDVTQSIERFEQAQQLINTSKAELTKAEAQAHLAKASAVQTEVNKYQFQTDLAAIDAAKAALAEAQLNLSYTKIVAPSSGRIGKKTVEEGQRIEPGQPLMTIVADNPWVVANFKETQLKDMKVGQSVEIAVDSFPDHKFEGTVLSFSPASGASFAILPSDNATGNFTKIVQRVPVKILFTDESIKGYEDRMAPGLSAVTSVNVTAHGANQKLATHKLADRHLANHNIDVHQQTNSKLADHHLDIHKLADHKFANHQL